MEAALGCSVVGSLWQVGVGEVGNRISDHHVDHLLPKPMVQLRRLRGHNERIWVQQQGGGSTCCLFLSCLLLTLLRCSGSLRAGGLRQLAWYALGLLSGTQLLWRTAWTTEAKLLLGHQKPLSIVRLGAKNSQLLMRRERWHDVPELQMIRMALV